MSAWFNFIISEMSGLSDVMKGELYVEFVNYVSLLVENITNFSAAEEIDH